MTINWKEVGLVAVAGALGGVLSWIYSEAVQSPLGLGWFGSPLASIGLGAGAAVLGVYMVAKTDMSTGIHALVFALACGFSWKPVLEGASALVETQVERATTASVSRSTSESVDLSEKLDAPGESSKEDMIEEAVHLAIEALRMQPKRVQALEDRSASLGEVVENILTATTVDTQDKIEGLRRIGSAAAAAGDQTLAVRSMAAISKLSVGIDGGDSVDPEAARAITEIGASATPRTRPVLEFNSRMMAERRRPDGPVRADFESRPFRRR